MVLASAIRRVNTQPAEAQQALAVGPLVARPLLCQGASVVFLQAVLAQELAERASIDVTDARRILSRTLREGRLPDKAWPTIRRTSLHAVRAIASLPSFRDHERFDSTVDPFVKYVFGLADELRVEAVRIPLERTGRFGACVSSQVGCALACAFCQTGRMGLLRNLEVWEIVEQVRQIRADLPDGGRVHAVVFQGMGEPLANVDRVIQAIRILSEPSGLAIDQRNITVCTAGLPAGILRLAHEGLRVRLGLSFGSARDDARRSLMPITNRHGLDEVIAAAGEHARLTRLSPMWAYTLLGGVNDAPEEAAALAARVHAFERAYGVRPRVRLIPFNPVEGAPFERSGPAALAAFRAELSTQGVGSIVRYSGGGDVSAACGQLATASVKAARSRTSTPRAARAE